MYCTAQKDAVEYLGADSYYGYVSGEGNFRKDICTLLPYKGNREALISPLYRKEVAEYLVSTHNANYTTGIEPDDAVTTDMLMKKTILVVMVTGFIMTAKNLQESVVLVVYTEMKKVLLKARGGCGNIFKYVMLIKVITTLLIAFRIKRMEKLLFSTN